MHILLIIALIVAAAGWRIHHRIHHFMDDMPEEQRAKWEQAMDEARQQQEKRSQALQMLTVYRNLRESIQDGMTVDEMIDAFAEMCKIPVGEPDDLLFETGTYNFTGENLFYFSLVRQFQFLNEDEYVQLHLDILYPPSAKTALLVRTTWDTGVEGDFFEMVKSSLAYRVVQDLSPVRVDVRVEET